MSTKRELEIADPPDGGEGRTSGERATSTEPSARVRRPPSEPPALARLDPGYLANLKFDVPASLVVFLVALPLCLGIAVASGAPPLAGLITGIIGGTVVSWLSGSHVAVSGPAAGLTVIILGAIEGIGYEAFLLAVVISGAMQALFGIARAGIFAYYFPSSVIKGMLAAIGLILIIKQIPHALGFDADFEGDMTLLREGQMGPMEAITFALGHVHVGAALVCSVGLAILITWDAVPALKKIRALPGPLVAVAAGIGLNLLFAQVRPEWAITGAHLVALPQEGLSALMSELTFPDFSAIGNGAVYTVAFTLAVVASLETLLCIEAMDKLDPYKRNSPTNRELVAQGIGQMLAGAIGGLPMTAVIVRGSTNIQAGGRTRMSSFLHGVLLLVAVVALPFVMNLIPLAALAAVLLHVGYKLARVEVFRQMFRQTVDLWLPFIVTIAAILATDLLMGVGIGVVVGVFFILRENLRTPYFIHRYETSAEDSDRVRIELSENVSFLNKASVNKVLQELPRGTKVEIDGSKSQYIHPDVLEIIHDFHTTAHARGVEVDLHEIPVVDAAPAH